MAKGEREGGKAAGPRARDGAEMPTQYQLAAPSLQQVAHSPSQKPFYLGLRQLWSKVDPLEQLGAPAWPNSCTEDSLPRHGNSQLLRRLGICCVQMGSRGQRRVTFQLRT